MRIAITGGAGRLGRVLLRELRDTHDVLVFDRASPQNPEGVRVRIGDHLDLGQVVGSLKGADLVVHLSADTCPGRLALTPITKGGLHEAESLSYVGCGFGSSNGTFFFPFGPNLPGKARQPDRALSCRRHARHRRAGFG